MAGELWLLKTCFRAREKYNIVISMIIFVLNTVRKVLAVADQDGKLDL